MQKLLLFILIFFVNFSVFGQVIPEEILNNLSTQQISEVRKLVQSPESIDTNTEFNEPTLIQKEIEPNLIFGHKYIKTTPTSLVATPDLPVPLDYELSIGDEFQIILTGTRNKILDVRVALDGSITFSEVGTINVLGETVKSLKNKLSNLIEAIYVGVDIDVTLKSLNSKKINILGAIDSPGTYLVSPFTTLSNVLAYTGGVSDAASLRKIKLIKPSGEVYYYDLYELLVFGSRENDRTLSAGDTVLITTTSNFIELTGEVHREAIYEFTDQDNLQTLIGYAQGLTNFANKEKISIKKYNFKENIKEEVEVRYSRNVQLENIFKVQVPVNSFSTNYRIDVSGELEKPGSYSSDDYKSLRDLINNLSFTDKTFPFLAVLEQSSEDGFSKEGKIFSLLDKNTQNIDFTNDARIIFLSEDNFLNTAELNIDESIKSLIKEFALRLRYKELNIEFPIIGNFSVSQVIEYLGIDTSDLFENQTFYISPLNDLAISGDWRTLNFDANKFHSLVFKFRDSKTIKVEIKGEVFFPGSYTVQKDYSFNDLVVLAGGLSTDKETASVIFLRDSIRKLQSNAINKAKQNLAEMITYYSQKEENVSELRGLLDITFSDDDLGRLSGDFFAENNDVELEDGDSIEIFSRRNTVSIIGNVKNPSTILFLDKYKLNDYLQNAGGFSELADRSGIYVISANGEIKTRGKFLFFRRSLEINPGDTIVVPPRKIVDPNLFPLIADVTQILSNLAFTSTSLNILRQN